MTKKETSIFIQKYKHILNFKSQVQKKSKTNERYVNYKTIEKNNNINNDNDNDNEKSMKLLPYINNNLKSVNSEMYIKEQLDKNNFKIKNSTEFPQKNDNSTNNLFEEINNLKKSGKEYREFIIKCSDISPKKNIKIINDDLYNRLIKKSVQDEKNLVNNSLEESIIKNYLNDKDKENKPTIILPFLKNVKSRYKDYNDEQKINSNESLILPINDNLKSNKRAKSSYKNKEPKKKKERKYHYLILKGNNSQLVEKCLITRPSWEKISNSKNLYCCNLIWTELSQEIDYSMHGEISLSQIINHFEFHNEISNKKNLFVNLIRYCEYNRLNLFSFYPLTIIIDFKKNYFNEQIEGFKQIFNDIPSFVEDINKSNENKKNYNDYFTINFIKRLGKTQKLIIPKSSYIGKNLWLLKRSNLNRGRNIKIFSDLDSIINEIEESKKERKCTHLLLQKYIEDPLLYNNRKFDIRIWVLFSYISKEYKFEAFVFKEGHLKACSENFNIDSNDLYVHLTNYSVQKYNKNFSKVEIGNEISFKTFQDELDKKGGKNFKKDVLPKIIKIIEISAKVSKNKINILARNNCFEIFGYDFILDKNYEPFLLEINTNPGLEESSPLIKMLVPRMIDDAFRLTVDEIFERNDEDKNISKFKVDGYTDEENMWKKVI